MSGAAIMDEVTAGIKAAIKAALAEAAEKGVNLASAEGEGEQGKEKEVKPDPLAPLMKQIRRVIVKGLLDYRAERTIYESTLGNFILEQIPYTTFENLDLPNLPATRDGENRWVRKSGVLANYTASHPLPKEEAIPAGDNVDFIYADWDYLREVEGEAGADPPEGDQKRPPTEIPPDLTTTYTLNIVKSIRLRYTLRDRRYLPDEAPPKKPRDLQTGYILISYAGSNNN